MNFGKKDRKRARVIGKIVWRNRQTAERERRREIGRKTEREIDTVTVIERGEI